MFHIGVFQSYATVKNKGSRTLHLCISYMYIYAGFKI